MLELNKFAAFEIAKMCNAQELAFRIRNRRTKLLGLWAAEYLGLGSASAESYARALVADGVVDPEDESLIRRVAEDFAAAGVVVLEASIRAEAGRLSGIAALEYREPWSGAPVAA